VPVVGEAFDILKGFAEAAHKRGSKWLFSTHGKVPMWPAVVDGQVAEVSDRLGGTPFNQRDLRGAAQTQLARAGVSEAVRAQLLSQGLGGLQNRHYMRHDFLDEKTAALKIWHARIAEIMKMRELEAA
jgi:hypothetical protein